MTCFSLPTTTSNDIIQLKTPHRIYITNKRWVFYWGDVLWCTRFKLLQLLVWGSSHCLLEPSCRSIRPTRSSHRGTWIRLEGSPCSWQEFASKEYQESLDQTPISECFSFSLKNPRFLMKDLYCPLLFVSFRDKWQLFPVGNGNVGIRNRKYLGAWYEKEILRSWGIKKGHFPLSFVICSNLNCWEDMKGNVIWIDCGRKVGRSLWVPWKEGCLSVLNQVPCSILSSHGQHHIDPFSQLDAPCLQDLYRRCRS